MALFLAPDFSLNSSGPVYHASYQAHLEWRYEAFMDPVVGNGLRSGAYRWLCCTRCEHQR
jgi:hypothetical protein